MAVAVVDALAAIDTGGGLLAHLLDSDGLGYESLVATRREYSRADWTEVHLLDSAGRVLVRYVERPAAGTSVDTVRRRLRHRQDPCEALFTVVATRESEAGPLDSPLAADLTFLAVDDPAAAADRPVDVTHFTVDRTAPTAVYRDLLDALAVEDGDDRATLADAAESVFSTREFTRRFYDAFDEVRRTRLRDAVDGLDGHDEAAVDEYVRTVVTRVLFLLFVEETGWLDGDTDYVERRYEAARADPDRHVYDDCFEPLFFEALTDPAGTDEESLGTLPFLNEELFSRREADAEARIEPEFFDALLDPEPDGSGTPTGLFRRYEISLRESAPGDRELVVDPAFVGRIFEMSVHDDERSALGAFYTPKSITRYMASDALVQHLVGTTDLDASDAATLVTDTTVPDTLSEADVEAVDRALRSARVLDPAVGSGAFVLAMLDAMVGVAAAVDEALGTDRSAFERKRALATETLYGVDVDRGGVERCTLRVWLSLLVALQDVPHEAAVERPGAYSLPNLDANVVVGNSLVGECDPTGVDADAVAEAVERRRRVLADYRTAHGEDRARLRDRLDEVTATITEQLAVRERERWMSDVAAAADRPFAWTATFPEVVLDGGFDVVIGNPPYEGQSRQAYVGVLARRYEQAYDCYETIPGMRHDLYQKFVVRGWELAREGGVLSYITSDTFYTIGSKRTTRNLLQDTRLQTLLRANPDTFDAAVEPAILTLRTGDPPADHRTTYVDASDAAIGQYRSLVGALTDPEPASTVQCEGYAVDRLSLPRPVRGYAAPLSLYRDALRGAFFEPTARNVALCNSVLADARTVSRAWTDAISDSDALEANLNCIAAEHLDTLAPGDVSILGLLTIGGQGLATADNDRYLAYVEGCREAGQLRARNDDFAYGRRNETPFRYLSRAVRRAAVAAVEDLSPAQRRHGIDGPEHWVPIVKGKGDPYYTPVTECIDWSRDAVRRLKSDPDARWQGYEYFFSEGLFVSRGGTGDPVVRYAPPAVIDSSGGIYIPTTDAVSARYLNGLLNSSLVQHLLRTFLNGTVNTQIRDMRLVPVVIPTADQRRRVEALVDQAIAVRLRESDVEDPAVDVSPADAPDRDIDAIAAEIDAVVADIYGTSAW